MPNLRIPAVASRRASLALALMGLASLPMLLMPGLVRRAVLEGPGWMIASGAPKLVSSMTDNESRALAAAIVPALSDGKGRAAAELPAATGPRAAIDQLQRHEADLALVPGILAQSDRAVTSEATRLIGLAGTRLIHVLAPADSALRGFDGLAGKRLGVGARGSAEESLARELAKTWGLNPAPQIVSGHNTDLEQAFLDGEIDAALLLRPVASPDVTTLMNTGYYRLVPLPANAAAAWALPGAFVASIPAQTYAPPATQESGAVAVPTLGVPVWLLCRADLSSTIAAAAARELHGAMSRAGEGAQPLAAAALPPGLLLHPAAARQQRDLSPLTSGALSDLAIGFAGLGLLFLAGFLLSRSRRDAHAELVLDFVCRSRAIEAALVSLPDAESLADARRQLALLDEEAESAWLGGRLAASELLLLRLGWGAELPERSADEVRERAQAMLPRTESPAPAAEKPGLLSRIAARAAAGRATAPAAPARQTLENPRPSGPEVRPIRREHAAPAMASEPAIEVAPALPTRPQPEPKAEAPDAGEDFFPEEEARPSRFTAYTPIDVFQGNDEFGSGALLDTIRVRRSNDDAEPAPPVVHTESKRAARQTAPPGAKAVREKKTRSKNAGAGKVSPPAAPAPAPADDATPTPDRPQMRLL